MLGPTGGSLPGFVLFAWVRALAGRGWHKKLLPGVVTMTFGDVLILGAV